LLPELERNRSDKKLQIASPSNSNSNFSGTTQGISAQISKLRSSFTPGATSRTKGIGSSGIIGDINSQIQQDKFEAVQSNKMWGLKSQESQHKNKTSAFVESF